MKNLLEKYRRTQSFTTRSWCRITDINWLVGIDFSDGNDYISHTYHKGSD